MEQREFLEICKKIAKAHSPMYGDRANLILGHAACVCRVDDPKKAFTYDDDHMEIAYCEDNGSMQVTLKAAFNGSSHCDNPVVMIMPDNDLIRFHGEAMHLFEHLEKMNAFGCPECNNWYLRVTFVTEDMKWGMEGETFKTTYPVCNCPACGFKWIDHIGQDQITRDQFKFEKAKGIKRDKFVSETEKRLWDSCLEALDDERN